MSNQHFYEEVEDRSRKKLSEMEADFNKKRRLSESERMIFPLINPTVIKTITTLFYPILINEYARELEPIKKSMSEAKFDPKEPFFASKTLDLEDIGSATYPFTVPCFIDKINPEESFEESLKFVLSGELTRSDDVDRTYVGLTAKLRKPYAKGCLAIISGKDPDSVGFRSLHKMQDALVKVLETIPMLVKPNFFHNPDEDVKLTLCFGGANIEDLWHWLEQFDYQYEIIRESIYSDTRILREEIDDARRRFYTFRKIIFPKKMWDMEVLRPPDYINFDVE